jgi:signal transduction histidine kinase
MTAPRASDIDPSADVRGGIAGIDAELLDVVGHDLKDPLAALVMGSAFLLKSLPDDEANARTRKMAQAIQRSAERMSALVKNLIDFARLERQSVVLAPRAHPIGEIADAFTRRLASAAQERMVVIGLDVADAAAMIFCDRERIEDALAHLGSNAVRYAPAGTEVVLRARVTEGAFVASISDRGAGLSDERREHLFDHEWHMRQKPRDGTGLGLTIARRLAALHGGEVRLDETGPRGSTFTLTIPGSPRQGG